MAQKEQSSAPQGMAGLVRYYEEEKALIKIKPVHVLGICVGFIVLEVMLMVIFPQAATFAAAVP
jgi:preprotein translocase subunit Sec61beta